MHQFKVSLYNNSYALSGIKNSAQEPEIIALHGWLDNAMSFVPLMQALPQYSIHALDLPGHGKSVHLPQIIPAYSMTQAAFILNEYFKTLTKPIVLMGHSLGAGLASLVAVLFPEKIKALLLLDNVIPIPNDDLAMISLKQLTQTKHRTQRTYTTVDAAVQARCKYGVTPDIAKLLAQRSVSQNEHGQYYWHHDIRLTQNSLSYFTTPDVKDIVKQIQQPVLYIHGDWDYRYQERLRAAQSLKNVKIVKISGDHYFHMTNIAAFKTPLKQFVDLHL
ncbi:alpha/beta hydrolase [bacterium]|nr:alpha/beta hydrolase [bacterium]